MYVPSTACRVKGSSTRDVSKHFGHKREKATGDGLRNLALQ